MNLKNHTALPYITVNKENGCVNKELQYEQLDTLLQNTVI